MYLTQMFPMQYLMRFIKSRSRQSASFQPLKIFHWKPILLLTKWKIVCWSSANPHLPKIKKVLTHLTEWRLWVPPLCSVGCWGWSPKWMRNIFFWFSLIVIFTSQAITRSAVNTSLGSTELTVTSSKPDNTLDVLYFILRHLVFG